MANILAVGLGGFIGSVLRYLIGLIQVSEVCSFPIKTFVINISGCILIGIISVWTSKQTVNPQLILLLKVGICGGFTTFSTFALETSNLLSNGHYLIAFLYVFGSCLIGTAVIFAVYFFAK